MGCPGSWSLKRFALPMLLLLWAGPLVANLHCQAIAASPLLALDSAALALPPRPGALASTMPAMIRSGTPHHLPPCDSAEADRPSTEAEAAASVPAPCTSLIDPYQRFLETTNPVPIDPRQKGALALHNLIDPGNLLTVFGTSAFTIASNPHTAYGPGVRGFATNSGVTLLQDATGEFFGTFLIPALTHQGPRYHRLPQASIPKRFIHALSRTIIAQRDNGRPMPNYAALLTYPITAEISNLYVPGIHGNGPSTMARIALGLGTDPVENLVTEFLPDLAKRVHLRVIFVQRLLNGVARDPDTSP